jgi:hypothetical protein
LEHPERLFEFSVMLAEVTTDVIPSKRGTADYGEKNNRECPTRKREE